MPTCASQEFLSLSRQILASFCPRSCRPMCQRQANQVDMIMFRPGDPLNCSWCLPGVSLAGGWRAGGRGHVSPGNGVMFGWCSTVVLSDQRSQSCQAGRRAGGGGGVGLAGAHYHVLLGNGVSIGWLLLWVFPADGDRVGSADRPGRRDHIVGNLFRSF